MDVDGFNDPYLASLYELECPWCSTDDFYLELVRSAGDVLDVGCGTGILLGAAAAQGHPGRLVGLDPADGMLTVARGRAGVDWVSGFPDGQWTAEFDLVTMTGNAFQELRRDDDIEDIDTVTVVGALVTFTETYDAAGWPEPKVARSTLRFVPVRHLDDLLARAGFEIDARFGDWDRSAFDSESEEIITVASVP